MPIYPIRPVPSPATTVSSPGPSAPGRRRTTGADVPSAPIGLNPAVNGRTPNLTVIVPTRNEKHTIGLLLARLGPAVAPLNAEVIVVDDSDDETPEALVSQAGTCAIPVRLLHRLPGSRKGGLSSAVIAGTIGGGGKLEFTLIGDTVNVAARVEQLTKTTGDAILLTQQCVDALASRPPGLIDRGFHVLKGKSASVQVFGLGQETDARVDLTT